MPRNETASSSRIAASDARITSHGSSLFQELVELTKNYNLVQSERGGATPIRRRSVTNFFRRSVVAGSSPQAMAYKILEEKALEIKSLIIEFQDPQEPSSSSSSPRFSSNPMSPEKFAEYFIAFVNSALHDKDVIKNDSVSKLYGTGNEASVIWEAGKLSQSFSGIIVSVLSEIGLMKDNSIIKKGTQEQYLSKLSDSVDKLTQEIVAKDEQGPHEDWTTKVLELRCINEFFKSVVENLKKQGAQAHESSQEFHSEDSASPPAFDQNKTMPSRAMVRQMMGARPLPETPSDLAVRDVYSTPQDAIEPLYAAVEGANEVVQGGASRQPSEGVATQTENLAQSSAPHESASSPQANSLNQNVGNLSIDYV